MREGEKERNLHLKQGFEERGVGQREQSDGKQFFHLHLGEEGGIEEKKKR